MEWSSDRTFINWFFINSLLFGFLLRRLHGRWDEGQRKMIKMSPPVHSQSPPEEAPWSGWRRPGRRVWRVNWVLGTATTCQKKTTLYLYFQFGISVFVSLLVLEVMPVTLCVFVSRLRIAAIFHQHGMCSIQFKGYTMSCTQCIVCRLKCVLCNFSNFNLWFLVFLVQRSMLKCWIVDRGRVNLVRFPNPQVSWRIWLGSTGGGKQAARSHGIPIWILARAGLGILTRLVLPILVHSFSPTQILKMLSKIYDFGRKYYSLIDFCFLHICLKRKTID